MINELTNILMAESARTVAYSNLWADILTVVWSFIFIVLYLANRRICNKPARLTPSHSQTIRFGLLMTLVCWGAICNFLFASIAPQARISWSVTGLTISFFIFTVFVFLIVRKKPYSFRVKLPAAASTVFLTIAAGTFAVASAYFLLASLRVFMVQLLCMFVVIYTCCHICMYTVEIAVLKYETKSVEEKIKHLKEKKYPVTSRGI